LERWTSFRGRRHQWSFIRWPRRRQRMRLAEWSFCTAWTGWM